MSDYDDYFLYVNRSVLAHYRASPDKYILEEDIGGVLKPKSNDNTFYSWAQIRFGFRKLQNGEVCLAVFSPDAKMLPKREQLIWIGHSLKDNEKVFSKKDSRFERWINRYFKSLMNIKGDSLSKIKKNVQLVQSLTNQTIGEPLFCFEGNELINYPVADNTNAYIEAHKELSWFLPEGLNGDAIDLLAKKLKIELPHPEHETVNNLEAILPTSLKEKIIEPLRKTKKTRNKLHKRESKQVKYQSAFEEFDSDIHFVAEGLIQLLLWLESVLNADAGKCFKREKIMNSSFFETIEFSSKWAKGKRNKVELAEGKTVQSIKLGRVPKNSESHTSEALMYNFTDGTSMLIRTGTNVGNLLPSNEKIELNSVDIDFVITWLPSIEKDVKI